MVHICFVCFILTAHILALGTLIVLNFIVVCYISKSQAQALYRSVSLTQDDQQLKIISEFILLTMMLILYQNPNLCNHPSECCNFIFHQCMLIYRNMTISDHESSIYATL